MARANQGWEGLTHFGLTDVNSSNVAQIESCAKCHARRGFVHPGHHANDSFLDHFLPEVVQPWSPDMQVPTYHVDGQIDDEVYVYGSYVQSKMFHKGIRCVDCHDPHTVKLHTYTNQLCTRCHVPNENNPTGFDTPIIISISQVRKEPSVWSVTCRIKLTWASMIAATTASEFRVLTTP